MAENILVIAEHAEGRLNPITWELTAFARHVQAFGQAPIQVIILGEQIEDLAHEILNRTGLDVAAVEVRGLKCFHGEAYTAILEAVISAKQPAITIAGHSSQGWDFAPRLAARLGTSCITGVTGLRMNQDRICFQRPVCGGRILADTISLTEGTIVTVQPGIFKELEACRPGGSLERFRKPLPSLRTEILGVKAAPEQDSEVVEADVIIAAGRGIGTQDNLRLIRDLAALFPRSAVGGSRPLCDQGWLPYCQQIGLTGATVSPKLYIACGISGTYQHLAGMRDSQLIVAINKDRHAAIFDHADVAVVEELEKFIPLLMDAVRRE